MSQRAVQPYAAAPDLVGRSRELSRIDEHLLCIETDGRSLILTGEPGVGKTTLLDVAAGRALDRGFRVERMNATPFEADVDYAGLTLALVRLFAEFGRGLRISHRSMLESAFRLGDHDPSTRLVVSQAVLELIRAAAEGQPLLLLIDDFHRLDRPSAGVLGLVSRRLSGVAAGLIAAQPSDEWKLADTLEGADRLDVLPLDSEAASALIGSRFPHLAPRVRQRLMVEARGNPLALIELPSALQVSQRTALGALPAILPLNQPLKTMFTTRITGLSVDVRHSLLMLALDAGRASQPSPAQQHLLSQGDLSALESAGLVRVEPSSRHVVFRHPLIRSAVVELSESEELRSANLLLAQSYCADPDRHAWYLADAAVSSDEHVASLLDGCASRSFRRGDPVSAVAALSRAADLSPSGLDRSRRLTYAAYLAATSTGDLDAVSQLLLDSRVLNPDFRDSLVAAVAAAALMLNAEGDVDGAHRLLSSALTRTADASSDELVEQALHLMMLVCRFANRHDLWASYFQHLRAFEHASDALRLESKLFGRPTSLAVSDLAQLDATLGSLADEADASRIARVGQAAFYLDRLGTCHGAFLNVVREGRDGGSIPAAIQAATLLAHEARVTGAWDDAERLAIEGIELCRRHGYQLLRWASTWQLAVLAAMRGQRAETARLTDEMTRWASPRGVLVVDTYCRQARGIAALGEGDFEDAYREFSALTPPGVLASGGTVALWTTLDLVESAWRTERRDEAEAHALAVDRAGVTSLSPRLALLGEAAIAVVAPDTDAVDRFDHALRQADEWRWPFDRAHVHLVYGERLRRMRAVTEARSHLALALETFQRLGADRWADRAANELRATGETRAQLPPQGRDSLTSQEREIAGLAASGLTNKQIGQRLYVSPRTVSAHLYRIFPKLGVSTRAALRDALQDSVPSW